MATTSNGGTHWRSSIRLWVERVTVTKCDARQAFADRRVRPPCKNLQDIYEEGTKTMIRRVLYLTIIVILLAMIIEARQMTFAPSAPPTPPPEVTIAHFSFPPATLTAPTSTS